MIPQPLLTEHSETLSTGTLRTDQVSEIFGLTLRQLQLWAEYGLVEPDVVDHQRRYSRLDALLVGVIWKLRACGVATAQIKAQRELLWRALWASADAQFAVVWLAFSKTRAFRIAEVQTYRDADAVLRGTVGSRWSATPTAFVLISLAEIRLQLTELPTLRGRLRTATART